MPQVAAPDPCPQCGGRGWVVEPDGAAGGARRCACRRRDAKPRLLEAAGVPPRYRGCRLDNFDVSQGPQGARDQLVGARKTARHYVEEFQGARGEWRGKGGLLFIGPTGVGKTHLAVAVLIELIEQLHLTGRFVDFTSLVYQIQATFDTDSQDWQSQILEPFVNADVLVLDELGGMQPSPWVNDVLYLIVNGRYTRRQPTIFTTNYRLELEQRPQVDLGMVQEKETSSRPKDILAWRIPAMLLSRLHEMAVPVLLTSVRDFRVLHAAPSAAGAARAS
ncbi:MAG TPA: ATP-binding protein [Thermoanaerobaculia bacterium]